MNRKIKIVVADDHQLVRKGFISLLEEDSRISIIGEAENGKKLLELIKVEEPDIILLDLEMPIMNGDEALTIIAQRFPKIKVIILSMHFSDELVKGFMAKGARGYLPKECDVEILFEAIHCVKADNYYFNYKTSKALLNGYLNEKSNASFDKLCLTNREVEILKQICEGKTNKEIGEVLHISASTVDFHRRNIYEKTKARNPAALAIYAVKQGIICINNEYNPLRGRVN